MAKKSPQINGGSMSDISFLLLTFFLLTSSINTDQGLTRKLPPPLPPGKQPKIEIHERNVLKVFINFSDQLRVNEMNMDISELKETAKDFFANPEDNPKWSEHVIKEIEGLGEVPVSKGVVSLQNDKGTSYEMYVKVQNELTAAINELRDELSVQKYGVKVAQLKSEDRKEAIQKAVPVAISEAEPKDYGGKK